MDVEYILYFVVVVVVVMDCQLDNHAAVACGLVWGIGHVGE